MTIAGHELSWGEEFELEELPDRRTAKERRHGPQTAPDDLAGKPIVFIDLDEEGYEPEDEDGELDEAEFNADDFVLVEKDDEE